MITRNLKSIALAGAMLAGLQIHAQDKVTYEDHVLPILRNACLKCHNPDKMKADLDLSTYNALIKGSGTGEIVAGGDVDGSFLYQVIVHAEEPTMPPNGKLSDKEIEVFKKWIVGGLLENTGSKAVMADKPKVDLAIDPDSLGKRPEGPAPMPIEVLALDPYVRTSRSSISTAIAVNPWSPLVAIGGQRQVLLYNTDNLKIAGIIPFPKGYPHSVNFSANGKLLVIGGGRGANLGFSTVWDITKGEQLLTVGEDLDAVLATDISADQRYIAHGGPDRFVRIFSTDTGEMLHKIKKHTDWVTSMRFGPKGKFVASGDRAGGIHVWEAEPGGRVASLMGHRGRITGLEWVSTNVVASVSEDGTGKLWNIDEVRQLKSWTAHGGGATSLRRAQNGDMVTVGRNRRATLWDSGGNAKRSFTFTGDIPSTGVPTHDGQRVIGTDWTGQVFVWNSADGAEIGRLSLNPTTMAEQYATAQKAVGEKAAAAQAAEAAHKAVLDRIAKAKADLRALDAAVAMRQKAVTDTKATLDKLVAEKQKPAQDKANTAAKAVETATANKTAADKALAEADEAGKAAAEAKVAEAAKALTAAQANKEATAKTLAAVNTEVTQATTINAAANKSFTDAQAKATAGKRALTKQIGDLDKAAAAEQAKVTAAGAALTAAQNDADTLNISKTFAALYSARRTITGQEAKYAELKAEAESATAALQSSQAALETVKKVDVQKLKAERLNLLNQAKTKKTQADQALADAKAELTKSETTITAAKAEVTKAEAGLKEPTTALATAQAVHTRAAAEAKAMRAKATAAQGAYDQLAAAKQTPTRTIATTVEKALAQAKAARANAAKAVTAIDAEVKAAAAALPGVEETAKAAETAAAQAKTALDKLSADLARQKADLDAKTKTSLAAKMAMDQLIAAKQKPAEAKVADAAAALKQAPVTKANADKALAEVNAQVKAALEAFRAAEMAAQAAEAGAGNDGAKQVAALKLREASDNAKAKLDALTNQQQKAARAKVAEANAAMVAAPKAKTAADQVLAAVKAEVSKAGQTHTAAVKVQADSQKDHDTVAAGHAKAKATYESRQATATQRRAAATKAKAHHAGLVANKQQPAQIAATAAAETVKELTAAHTSSVQVLKVVEAEMAEARKPVVTANTIAITAEAAEKAAAGNVAKMTAVLDAARKVLADRKQAVVNAEAAMAKMMTEKLKPMETAVSTAAAAMAKAQATHDNTEKEHQALLAALTQTVATQTTDAKTKQAALDEFTPEVTEARKKLEALEAEYQKLKSAAAPQKEPTKTAAK